MIRLSFCNCKVTLFSIKAHHQNFHHDKKNYNSMLFDKMFMIKNPLDTRLISTSHHVPYQRPTRTTSQIIWLFDTYKEPWKTKGYNSVTMFKNFLKPTKTLITFALEIHQNQYFSHHQNKENNSSKHKTISP